jgi:hypothetical protein
MVGMLLEHPPFKVEDHSLGIEGRAIVKFHVAPQGKFPLEPTG